MDNLRMCLALTKTTVVAIGLWIYYTIIAALPWGLGRQRRNYKGQLCLVTGAGSGIGRLLSERLAARGARLVLWDVNEVGNEETAKICQGLGAQVAAYKVDLSSREAIIATAERVRKEVGVVEVLINNAGIVTGAPIDECSDSQIERTFKVNVLAHFWILRSFLADMKAANHGQIVTIASGAGLFGAVDLVDYCSSKFAAVGMTESLALELDTKGYDGIALTLVCPYYINTGMFDGVRTRFNALMPIMEPDYAVGKILSAMEIEKPVLIMPRLVYFLYFLKGFLPTPVGFYLAHELGVSHSMDHFRGRRLNNNNLK